MSFLVWDNIYSKTLQFYDINYKLAQDDDKAVIFESWCDCRNYFDSEVNVQIGFVNRHGDLKGYESIVDIKPARDSYDDVSIEYASMLKDRFPKDTKIYELITTKPEEVRR